MRSFRIASHADVERIESRPYAEYMAHASVLDALADAARSSRPTAPRSPSSSTPTSRPRRSAGRTANSSPTCAAPPTPSARWPEATSRVSRCCCRRSRRCYFALWGAETAGVACPINYLLNADHIAELIDASGANLLVALGPNPELDIWSRVAGLRARCPGLKRVLAVGGARRRRRRLRRRRCAHSAATRSPSTVADRAPARSPPCSTPAARPAHPSSRSTRTATSCTRPGRRRRCTRWTSATWSSTASRCSTSPARSSTASRRCSRARELVLPTLLGMRNARFVPRYWDVVARHRVTLLAVVPTDPVDAPRRRSEGRRPGQRARRLHRRLAAAARARRQLRGAPRHPGAQHPRHDRMRRRRQHRAVPRRAPRRARAACALPFTRGRVGRGRRHRVCAPGEPGVLRLRGPNVGPGYTDARRNAGTFERRRLARQRRHRPRRRRRHASSSPAAPRT